jgi:hypothetical protein
METETKMVVDKLSTDQLAYEMMVYTTGAVHEPCVWVKEHPTEARELLVSYRPDRYVSKRKRYGIYK